MPKSMHKYCKLIDRNQKICNTEVYKVYGCKSNAFCFFFKLFFFFFFVMILFDSMLDMPLRSILFTNLTKKKAQKIMQEYSQDIMKYI